MTYRLGVCKKRPESAIPSRDSEPEDDNIVLRIKRVDQLAKRIEDLRGKRAAGFFNLGRELCLQQLLYSTTNVELKKKMNTKLIEAMWENELSVELIKAHRKVFREDRLNEKDFNDSVAGVVGELENFLMITPERVAEVNSRTQGK